MKKSLGKFFLLLLPLLLSAKESATITTTISNKKPFIKEAVVVEFAIAQKDHSTNMFFFVEPKKSSDYEIYLLQKSSKEISNHNSVANFRFVVFGKRAKKSKLAFEFLIKTASDQAVRQAFVSDHDDSIAINTKLKEKRLLTIPIEFQPLQKEVDLVGDFQLKATIDTTTIYPYQSVNLSYKLQGVGYAKKLQFFQTIPHTNLFFALEQKEPKLTPQGFKIEQEYLYSISASKEFSIPKITLHAFNPKTKRYYTLQTKPYTISIKTLSSKELLDAKDAPKTKPLLTIAQIQNFFECFAIFLFGFFTAKLLKKHKKKADPLAKIKATKDAKELLKLLLHSYPYLQKEIVDLEAIVYEKRGDFLETKKRVLQKLQSNYSSQK